MVVFICLGKLVMYNWRECWVRIRKKKFGNLKFSPLCDMLLLSKYLWEEKLLFLEMRMLYDILGKKYNELTRGKSKYYSHSPTIISVKFQKVDLDCLKPKHI